MLYRKKEIIIIIITILYNRNYKDKLKFTNSRGLFKKVVSMHIICNWQLIGSHAIIINFTLF